MVLSRRRQNKNALRRNTAIDADVTLSIKTRMYLLWFEKEFLPLIAGAGFGNAVTINWVTIAGFPVAVATDRRVLQMNPKQ